MAIRRQGGVAQKRSVDAEAELLNMGLLDQSVGYRLRRAQLAIFAKVTQYLKDVELRPGQVGVLTLIERNPGITQAEVCTALGIQRANLVTLINALEKRRVVERQAVAEDRRSNALVLTTVGRRLLRKATDAHRSVEAGITRKLGAGGRDQLLRLLNLLAE
jgi:DNA-binding MarR family transcriptional regulator